MRSKRVANLVDAVNGGCYGDPLTRMDTGIHPNFLFLTAAARTTTNLQGVNVIH